MKAEVSNKIVVITGGGQGIGKNMALTFAKLGSKVIICSRTRQDLEDVEKEIKDFGGFCESYVVDVAIYSQVEKFFQNVIKKHGVIDVLITCAGIYGPIGSLDENDIEDWKKAIGINLLGTVNSVKSIMPFMKHRKEGKIITLCGGGIGGPNIVPNFSAYTTSKAAIAGFTEALSKELLDYNVQINAISPGAVNTRLLDIALKAGEKAGKEFLEKCRRQKLEGGTPPEKSAGLVVFLASKESNHITGKVLSAVWDDIAAFHNIKDELARSSIFNLRRIDGFMFFEKKSNADKL
jgi:NAD(P)-dependent dehydrogenase (short-subunit alcohol dehydrogenase family)